MEKTLQNKANTNIANDSKKMMNNFLRSLGTTALLLAIPVLLQLPFAEANAQNRSLNNQAQTVNQTQPQDADAPLTPPMPTLKAVPGNGSVLLYWDDVAESHFDPFFEDYIVFTRPGAGGEVFANPNNFQGYKIYKSTDPTFSDILRITDNRGNPIRLQFEAIFDLQNEIRGYHPASIGGQRLWLGSDTGIRRIWEDTGLMNGVTYYYAVVSFTHGDALPNFDLPVEFNDDGEPVIPIPNTVYTHPPLESPIDVEVLPDGSVVTGINVVAVTPQQNAPGYVAPVDPVITQTQGTGSGNINLEIIDPAALRGGNEYAIVFEDTLVAGIGGVFDLVTQNFSLLNTTTGEFLHRRIEDLDGTELPVKEGLLLTVSDIPERVAPDFERSEWITNQSANIHNPQLGVSSRNPTPFDYRVEIYNEPVSSSTPFQIGNNNLPSEETNVRVFNTTTGQEVEYAFFTNPQLPRDVRTAAYLSENSILVGGAAGLIQRSTDGGVNWTNIESGQSVRIKSFSFINENQGWASGREGVVIRTTDGGITWSDALPTGSGNILRDIFFINENLGWAVGDNGRIIRTTDGGSSWTFAESGTIRRLNEVFFINENVGYVTGLLATLKTMDGGVTWQELTTGVQAEFFGMHFNDENTGWLVGTAGRILETSDGGETWTLAESNTSSTLNSITFVNASTGWAVGQNGSIVKTTDAGETWQPQTSGIGATLFGISALNTERLVVTGANSTRLRTINGGESWSATADFRRFRAALDDNNQSRSDILYILENVGENNQLADTWRISMLARTASSSFGLTVDPAGGDELQFFTIKPFTSSDRLEFSIQGENQPSVDLSSVESPLDDIRVVPNPYLVSHEGENATSGRQLHFTNLPQQCTIRIFSVSGRLLQTINVNNGPGESRYIWNMVTNDNRNLSYGVYIYHVNAPGVGEKVGKFAVIK
ncbi:MAG: hypothetical protein LAT67_15615 [Balneolales bacterium]|nr:hypothetical protein [Balneolales bacterium]